MPRSTSGPRSHARRKKILKLAKGYRGARSKLFRTAKNQVFKSLSYAYRDRRNRRRAFRRLWISRINAATRQNGLRYSEFVNLASRKGVELDRKVLADIALRDAEGFAQIVAAVKEG
jgi:large subunit ribosomal protein L20